MLVEIHFFCYFFGFLGGMLAGCWPSEIMCVSARLLSVTFVVTFGGLLRFCLCALWDIVLPLASAFLSVLLIPVRMSLFSVSDRAFDTLATQRMNYTQL
jgi:predicted branched-subunit amino acid permease